MPRCDSSQFTGADRPLQALYRAPIVEHVAPVRRDMTYRSPTIAWSGAVIFCLLILLGAIAPAQVDVKTIIERSVEANKANWEAAPRYNNYETDKEDGGPAKTNEVIMIEGSPCKRLVAINGMKLSPEQQQEEDQNFGRAVAERRHESLQQRSQRIAKYESDRRRDHEMMSQLTQGFDFELKGVERMGPYQVYALKATPRLGYRPPNTQARVLTAMEGMLWVDTKTYQWVKVEAKVIHPVRIAGFLATVEPGTRFELENTPVGDGIWQPKHFAMSAHAKVLFMFSHKNDENDSFFGYRRADYDKAATAISSAPRSR